MAIRLFVALWENVASAFSAMWGQKLRSMLTLIGIVAGVATVILMVSFVAGFNNSVTEAFTELATPATPDVAWRSRLPSVILAMVEPGPRA